jgi:hypothetical protein
MGEMKNVYKILVASPEGRRPRRMTSLSTDGRIKLKCILGKWGWRVCNELSWLTIGTSG